MGKTCERTVVKTSDSSSSLDSSSTGHWFLDTASKWGEPSENSVEYPKKFPAVVHEKNPHQFQNVLWIEERDLRVEGSLFIVETSGKDSGTERELQGPVEATWTKAKFWPANNSKKLPEWGQERTIRKFKCEARNFVLRECFDYWFNFVSSYWSVKILFLPDSTLENFMFLRLYPLFPGSPIHWHKITPSTFL